MSSLAALPDACVAEAQAIIETAGLENLSLRDVARRLGVSHQAPYKHFPTRDHLLAEVVTRAFGDFARHLDARERSDDAADDLAAMGRAYVGYALSHPQQYDLMFGTSLPDPAQHPSMLAQARHAFALLQEALRRVAQHGHREVSDLAVDLDALFIWATMHGLATILQSSALRTLELSPRALELIPGHMLDRIRSALDGPIRAGGAP